MHHDEVYCVKCRHSVKPLDCKKMKDKRGRPRLCGECPHCETMCYKYISFETAAKMKSPRKKKSPKRRR